jgi:hypothetical protein
MAVWPWYGGLAKGWLYEAAEFLQVQEYKNVQRWADTIWKRPAVQPIYVRPANDLAAVGWVSEVCGPYSHLTVRVDIKDSVGIGRFYKEKPRKGLFSQAVFLTDSAISQSISFQPCRSKRSRLVTLVQAVTKSLTNFSFASVLA